MWIFKRRGFPRGLTFLSFHNCIGPTSVKFFPADPPSFFFCEYSRFIIMDATPHLNNCASLYKHDTVQRSVNPIFDDRRKWFARNRRSLVRSTEQEVCKRHLARRSDWSTGEHQSKQRVLSACSRGRGLFGE